MTSGPPLSRTASAARRLAFDGLARLDYRLRFSHRVDNRGNAILMYHAVGDPERYGNVSADRLRRDLRYVRDTFDVVGLREVYETAGDDAKTVAVTFDDAYQNFYRHALPVVRELGVPVTVFVPTGYVDGGNEDLAYRFVESPDERDDYNERDAHRVRTVDPAVMTTEQLEALADEPLVTLGNHTRTHPDLQRITDRETLESEIVGAKADLESTLGITVDQFCFPYGRYSREALDVVRESHDVAVTTAQRLVSADDDPHRLPRLPAHVPEPEMRWDLADLRWKLSGTAP